MKYKPGDVVICYGKHEGVIAIEEEPMGCCMCEDENCVEWANVFVGGTWLCHVPECKMELSRFGKSLRGEV